MVLPLGVDIIEFVLKGREMVMMENHAETLRKEGEEGSTEEECDKLSWESCLLRFNKFLGMSLEGYEDEALWLMYKICDRRQKGRGKEVPGMTKFNREMKKLEWIVHERKMSTKGSVGQGTRAILFKY